VRLWFPSGIWRCVNLCCVDRQLLRCFIDVWRSIYSTRPIWRPNCCYVGYHGYVRCISCFKTSAVLYSSLFTITAEQYRAEVRNQFIVSKKRISDHNKQCIYNFGRGAVEHPPHLKWKCDSWDWDSFEKSRVQILVLENFPIIYQYSE